MVFRTVLSSTRTLYPTALFSSRTFARSTAATMSDNKNSDITKWASDNGEFKRQVRPALPIASPAKPA